MADERDPQLTQHYRSLEKLEPPPELDQAVLAASRRATGRGRNRWYTSLAAAAVLVFAVALTLHIERDRRDADATSGPPLRLERELRGVIKPAPQPEAKTEGKVEPKVEPPVFAPDPQASQASSAAEEARPDAAAARPRAVPVPQRAPADDLRVRREQAANRALVDQAAAEKLQAETRPSNAMQQRAASAGAAPAAAPAAAPERPDRWIERIAELRSR